MPEDTPQASLKKASLLALAHAGKSVELFSAGLWNPWETVSTVGPMFPIGAGIEAAGEAIGEEAPPVEVLDRALEATSRQTEASLIAGTHMLADTFVEGASFGWQVAELESAIVWSGPNPYFSSLGFGDEGLEEQVLDTMSAGSSVAAIGMTLAPLSGAPPLRWRPTIWDDIVPTQGVYPGTHIPRSFELVAGEGRYWVHPNATEHLLEYMSRRPYGPAQGIVEQELLSSLQAAVEEAVAQGVVFEKAVRVGSWELAFSPGRRPADLVVIKHANYLPQE